MYEKFRLLDIPSLKRLNRESLTVCLETGGRIFRRVHAIPCELAAVLESSLEVVNKSPSRVTLAIMSEIYLLLKQFGSARGAECHPAVES